ncbi:MAG TPA: FAD-dependent oxidoreductase [Polyangiaceae bacterium]|nr:FAD-dependent oxidoreductase [Polyangiaceae bacterium]
MGSGDDGSGFYGVTLLRREDAGGGLSRVTIDPGESLALSYTDPGQYVEVRAAGEAGYFVLASEPRTRPWQLIMRAGGGVSDVLLVASPGDPLDITRAIGSGFPLREARGRHLIVAVGGTGVAAALPILRHRMRDGDERLTTILIGLRNEDEIPIQGELEAWAGAGVDVVVCLSQGPRAPASGKVRLGRGYIQDILRELAAAERYALRGSLVFAVGPTSMVTSLRDLAPELGIAAGDVVTNH